MGTSESLQMAISWALREQRGPTRDKRYRVGCRSMLLISSRIPCIWETTTVWPVTSPRRIQASSTPFRSCVRRAFFVPNPDVKATSF
jgi:hypothetical protein